MLTDLYTLRTKTNITIRQLAAESGVSKSTIHNIENGRTIPRVNTVCSLARVLDIAPEMLFLALIEGENF